MTFQPSRVAAAIRTNAGDLGKFLAFLADGHCAAVPLRERLSLRGTLPALSTRSLVSPEYAKVSRLWYQAGSSASPNRPST
jgi:hypothetical protein